MRMSKEKLLINDSKSNNGEVMRNKQISEIAKFLTEYADCGECEKCNFLTVCGEKRLATNLYNAGYRKQSENVIELPCKIGDTVYIIDETWDETIEPYVLDVKVLQFIINKHGIAVDLQLPLGMRQNSWMIIGENLFLTESEAEEALAKMKGGAE